MVYYTQQLDGVPVFRADLRLLVKNEFNYRLIDESRFYHYNTIINSIPALVICYNETEGIVTRGRCATMLENGSIIDHINY